MKPDDKLPFLFWLMLLFTLGEPPGLSETSPAENSGLPILPPESMRFSWRLDDTPTSPGPRTYDIVSRETSIVLQSSTAVDSELGLFAVDPLKMPTINGLALLSQLPTESAFTLHTDGTATFTYWDLYDPYWRGRQPAWSQKELEEATVTVDFLDDDPLPAKVARDAVETTPEQRLFLLDPEGGISFYWRGELRYCFDFGRKVTSLSLADPSGQHKTTLTATPGLEILLSNGSGPWLSVWRSETEGRSQPTITLPSALEGSKALCLSFRGHPDEYYTIEQLYFTARFQTPELGQLTRFPRGNQSLSYADAEDSTHRAILYWDDPAISVPQTPVEYPASTPTIESGAGTLTIRFPEGILLAFPLDDEGAPGALGRLTIAQQTVFQAPPGAAWTPPAWLTMLDGSPTPLPAGFKWSDYHREFQDSGQWMPRWTRSRQLISLGEARFEGAQVEAGEAVMRWTVPTSSGTGEVVWIFTPARARMANMPLTGVSMRLRVSGDGLASAESISYALPLLVSPGDRQLEQAFRNLVEERFSFQAAPAFSQAKWFGESQSFVFHTGPGRTVLGGFHSPVWAKVRQSIESGRHYYHFDIPLGTGQTREPPRLYWFAVPQGAATRWNAADLWAHLYEDIKSWYGRLTGVLNSRPIPTVVWNLPQLDGLPDSARGWFDWFTQTQLPRAETAAVGNLIIQSPWTSDAEKQTGPGSGHAPYDFQVSPLQGGRDALKRLVTAAHHRGLKITLWYPSAFSLSSPLPEKNPGWVAWKSSGIPEDGGWGDIVSLDTGTAYRDHAIEAVSSLHREIPFDGVWMDSWAGMAVVTDYSDAQPAPRLDKAIALQKAFTDLGLSQIVIEGLGPLGRSDAYGDYESHFGPPRPESAQTEELERLRNHEYLLYQIGANTPLDMEIYHHTLASGGLINIANLDEIDVLSSADQRWLRQLHLDHQRVVDRMQYRTLLTDNEHWLGTAWTRGHSEDVVIFAFTAFRQQVEGTVTVEDVTEGKRFEVTDELLTRPYHTYLILNAIRHSDDP